MSASVLLLGQDPATIDFSKSAVPGMTAEKVAAGTAAARAQLEALGYRVVWCLTEPWRTR